MSYIDISALAAIPTIRWAAQAHCKQTWRWDSQQQMHWKGFNLWFVAGGKGCLQVEGETYALTAGDCFLLRMWERHQGLNDHPDVLRIPFVVFNYFDKRGQSLTPEKIRALPPRHRRINNIAFFDGLMERIIHYQNAGEIEKAKGWLNGALMEIERQDLELLKKMDSCKRVEIFKAFAKRLSERPWERVSLLKESKQAGYSMDHFIRLFKASIGMTPGEYLIQVRIAAACNRLVMSNSNLSVVSEELGYSDVFAFCKQFKLKTGLSPSQYRRQGWNDASDAHPGWRRK